MPRPAQYGETLARQVDLRIAAPVANTAAITALPATERVDGLQILETATGTTWWFDADSAESASSTVLVPDAGSGRWLALVDAGDVESNMLRRTLTVTSADLTTTGTGPETETVGAVLPVTAVVLAYRISLIDAFDNGSGVSLTMELGHSNDVDAYEDGFDCFTSSALEGAGWCYVTPGPGIGVPAWDGTAVGQCVATFTAGADQLANFTNGEVQIEILAIDLG